MPVTPKLSLESRIAFVKHQLNAAKASNDVKLFLRTILSCKANLFTLKAKHANPFCEVRWHPQGIDVCFGYPGVSKFGFESVQLNPVQVLDRVRLLRPKTVVLCSDYGLCGKFDLATVNSIVTQLPNLFNGEIEIQAYVESPETRALLHRLAPYLGYLNCPYDLLARNDLSPLSGLGSVSVGLEDVKVFTYGHAERILRHKMKELSMFWPSDVEAIDSTEIAGHQIQTDHPLEKLEIVSDHENVLLPFKILKEFAPNLKTFSVGIQYTWFDPDYHPYIPYTPQLYVEYLLEIYTDLMKIVESCQEHVPNVEIDFDTEDYQHNVSKFDLNWMDIFMKNDLFKDAVFERKISEDLIGLAMRKQIGTQSKFEFSAKMKICNTCSVLSSDEEMEEE